MSDQTIDLIFHIKLVKVLDGPERTADAVGTALMEQIVDKNSHLGVVGDPGPDGRVSFYYITSIDFDRETD
jgi:hypothetical protein